MISVLKTCFPARKKGLEEGKFGVPTQLGKNAGSARKLARQVRPPPLQKTLRALLIWDKAVKESVVESSTPCDTIPVSQSKNKPVGKRNSAPICPWKKETAGAENGHEFISQQPSWDI
jgi:hypothetical protein